MIRKMALVLLSVMLFILPAAAEEGQRAPDYLLEGFDDASHDWETNRFFQRMQERTGIVLELREHADAEGWDRRKQEIAAGEDLPDVLFKAQLTPAETMAMAAGGILIDLKPYLPEYAPDLWKILQEHPEITGIICGNDTMACGATEACIKAGREDIKIIGLDGSDEAAAYIKDGKMVGTALQQIAAITELAIEQADAYIKNGTLPETEKQLVPCVAITKDNVDKLSAFVYTGE